MTERSEVNPAPLEVQYRGRVAEWLKAHDWKSCGHCPRGFESHLVRTKGSKVLI